MTYDAENFDPFAANVIADPYPWYRALHEGERVLHLDRWDIYVLSRHPDVRNALRDHTKLSSADGVTYVRAPLPMMLTVDPPDHERLRRIVGREFAPRDVHRFTDIVERFVREGFDEMEADDDPDLVRSIAIPVPIRLMAAILGVPERDIPELRRMSDDLVQGFSINPWVSEAAGEVNFDYSKIGRAITDIHTYFTGMIAERRAEPADDLVTKLSRPDFADSLSEAELLWFCLLLLVAGIETTTNLLGNMVIAFSEYPDEWEKLKAHPELVRPGVSEALRFVAPIQNFFRTASQPHVVDGVEIPFGARVMLVFGAANRDPQHYEDADHFRIERDPTDHVAFGAGIHRCLGAGLAELEGRIVLEELLKRTDEIEVTGDVVRTSNPTLRGALRLPMRLDRR